MRGGVRADGGASVLAQLDVLQAVWRDVPDALALSDRDGIVLAVNPAYCALYGYPEEALVGHSFALIFPPEQRAWAEQEYRQVFDAGQRFAPYEATVVRADGTQRFVESRIGFVERDGQRVALLSTIRDLTAQREAEAALAAERDRLRQILDALPVAVLVGDAASLTYTLGNSTARALLGVDLVGQPLRTGPELAPGTHRLDGSAVTLDELPVARSLRLGETVSAEQLAIRAADGTERTILLGSAPLRVPAGEVAGVVAVFQDIGAVKDLERQKMDFLAAVSHDLQQPLTLIAGRADLLLRRLNRGPAAPEDLTPGVQAIRTAAAAMADQLTGLLDATRLEAGHPLDLVRTPTDLVALAQQAVAEQQAATEVHELRFESAVEALVGPWDPARLRRVLGNLLGNAIKYSPAGGEIVVWVEREDTPGGATALLRVSDKGLGIPPADLPLVFERYHRAPNVAALAGTGLGLAGARQVVQQHAGTISVESQEGRGTTFTVRLPL